jgi:hypothetical protein
MGIWNRLFGTSASEDVVTYDVQEIQERIQVDPMYRSGTTQPSIFLNGNYIGNVTVFSFLGANWTISTQDGIVSIQTTGGGGGGSFVVKKDGNVVVASTTNLNFVGQAVTVVQNASNPNQADVTIVGSYSTLTSPNSTIAVGGTAANPTLDIAQQGATDGQVLTWNNTDGKYEPKTLGGSSVTIYNPATDTLPTTKGLYLVYNQINGYRIIGKKILGCQLSPDSAPTTYDSVVFSGDIIYCDGASTPNYTLMTSFISNITDRRDGSAFSINFAISQSAFNSSTSSGVVLFRSLFEFNNYINLRRTAILINVNFHSDYVGETTTNTVYLIHADASNIQIQGYTNYTPLNATTCTISGTIGNLSITYNVTTAPSSDYTVGSIIYIYNEGNINTNILQTKSIYNTTTQLGNHTGFYRITAVTTTSITITNTSNYYAGILSASDFAANGGCNIVKVTAINTHIYMDALNSFSVGYWCVFQRTATNTILTITSSDIILTGVFGASFESANTATSDSIVIVNASSISVYPIYRIGANYDFVINDGNVGSSYPASTTFVTQIINSNINLTNGSQSSITNNIPYNFVTNSYSLNLSGTKFYANNYITQSTEGYLWEGIIYNGISCNTGSNVTIIPELITENYKLTIISNAIFTSPTFSPFGGSRATIFMNNVYLINTNTLFVESEVSINKLYKLYNISSQSSNLPSISADAGSKVLINSYGTSSPNPTNLFIGKITLGINSVIIMPNATPSYNDTTRTVSLTGLPTSTKTFTVPATFITAIGGANAVNSYLVDTTPTTGTGQNLLITAVDTTNNIITVEQSFFATSGAATFTFGIPYFDLSDWIKAGNTYGTTSTSLNAYIGGVVAPLLLSTTIGIGATGNNIIPPSASGFMLAANKDGSGTAVPVTIIGGTYDPITQTLTISGGGGYASSFSTNTTSGQVPLVVNCTDTTANTSGQTPTGWAWSVIGGQASDYAISSATAQNPTVTFNASSAGNTYQIRLLASGSVTFTPALVTITPQAVPVTQGDFTIATTFSGSTKVLSFGDYTASSAISAVFGLSNAQTCSAVTSATITANNSSPVPTIPVTVASINSAGTVISGNLGQPSFPVTYTTTVVAVMNNSDSSTISRTHADTVSYYLPAFVIQNQLTTAPTFATSSPKLATETYSDGQGGTLTAGTDVQVLWVAIPTALLPTTLPKCWIYSNPFWASESVDGQSTTTIGGVAFTVLQYNLSGTGGSVLSVPFRISTTQPTGV